VHAGLLGLRVLHELFGLRMITTYEFKTNDPDLEERLRWINMSYRDRKRLASLPGFGKEIVRLFSRPDFFGNSHQILIHP
jgi:hypothetical protein